ncbi:molybdate ABC transporter substrate-binding protein [Snodgrassella sp. CFCC 13594]|uniref:molybdate ABC transporter substrate-binding protein n=1 Tax=Snodgrassella sp. CFCC 13594 TaxID=1775559 RepID=UPI000ABEF0BD|nr:molybdate ABC transporter substrate-binding protein [Snodgrassella sp. CFCC 13594]
MPVFRHYFIKTICAAALLGATITASAADITVSAAASLTNAFNDIAKAYEAQHPQDKIRLNFGGSGALLQQIDKGAPVDVFASADQTTMDQAQAKKLINPKTRANFVSNSLVLITPLSNHLRIKNINDLKQPGVKRIAVGNPATVPAGRYTQAALQQANVWGALQAKIILTQDVRQALNYVSRQETEAGFVFGTDAAIMKDKVKVAAVIPTHEAITYPIAVLSGSRNQQGAQQFIRFVRSTKGQQILRHYGFQSPRR